MVFQAAKIAFFAERGFGFEQSPLQSGKPTKQIADKMEQIVLWVFVIYTLLLFSITFVTARGANSKSFFAGNKKSPWFVVAYGAIGASLSGVTFMSVPGWVEDRGFTYMLTVLGYLLGYVLIAFVLLPLYYKLNLISIYEYLKERFGNRTHRTGSFFFILSRTLGASLRMFIVIWVLYEFVFSTYGISFPLTVFIFLLLILLFTMRGGVKTIVWTDTLQTTCMLAALVISFLLAAKAMDFSASQLFKSVVDSDYFTFVNTDFSSRLCWWKQLLGGMFITIAMTGLDQEMMQKNLSCKDLRSAKKNMLSFAFVLPFVNFLFLCLGSALYIYAKQNGITASGDDLFPFVALNCLGPFAAIVFIVGLISALFPSSDGALTSLTTSFCIDQLAMEQREDWSEKKKIRIRHLVHLGFALLFVGIIIFYSEHRDKHLIDTLYQIAAITYGPLLGLFAFGIFTRRRVNDRFVPYICVASPVICFILSSNSEAWFGYSFDFELLLVNALLTCIGLFSISKKPQKA